MLQAAKQAKFKEQREVAAKPMTSWLAGEKLPPARTIPFRKTKAEVAKLEDMGAVLSRFLPAHGSLYISPKDAQEHFALSAKVCAASMMFACASHASGFSCHLHTLYPTKGATRVFFHGTVLQDLESISGCSKKKRKKEVAHPRKMYALEDVHALAWRLHRDESGDGPECMQHTRTSGIQNLPVQRKHAIAHICTMQCTGFIMLLFPGISGCVVVVSVGVGLATLCRQKAALSTVINHSTKNKGDNKSIYGLHKTRVRRDAGLQAARVARAQAKAQKAG